MFYLVIFTKAAKNQSSFGGRVMAPHHPEAESQGAVLGGPP